MTTAFEIRVEGERGAPTLRRLGCEHCVTGAQLMVRVTATPADLQHLVDVCSEHGLTIESIIRVQPR
jgi:hypothetical protein